MQKQLNLLKRGLDEEEDDMVNEEDEDMEEKSSKVVFKIQLGTYLESMKSSSVFTESGLWNSGV